MRTCWVANDSEVSDRHPRPCTICFSNILTLGEGWSVLTVGYVGDVGQLSWTNNRFFFCFAGPRGGQRIQVDHARPSSWWLFVHQPSRLRSVVRPCRLRLRWWHGSSCLSPRSHSRAWPVRVRRGPPVCVLPRGEASSSHSHLHGTIQ